MLKIGISYWFDESLKNNALETLKKINESLPSGSEVEISVKVTQEGRSADLAFRCASESALRAAFAHIGPLLSVLDVYGDPGHPTASDNVPAALLNKFVPSDNMLVAV